MRKLFLLNLLFGVILSLFLASTVNAEEVIQTQPSSDGKIEASISGAKVRRGVLTVKVSLKNASGSKIEPEIRYGKIYYADINEKKKYYALKDSNGKYIAGPQHYDWGGGTFKDRIPAGEKRVIWLKFPAPPETTKAIDIFVPGILPFEEVELKR